MLQAALREYSQDQVHTEVLKILDPDNELLLDLVSRFGKVRQQSKKASIACFFELQASNISALVGKSERTVRTWLHYTVSLLIDRVGIYRQ